MKNFKILLTLVILISMCCEVVKAASPPTKVYLREVRGTLSVSGSGSADEYYTAYFLMPVPFREQRPILVEVSCSGLKDFRFVHLNSPNVIGAARIKKGGAATLKWTSWVLVKENTYSDRPSSAPIPTIDELPDSVKKWLVPTDISQVNAPIVQEIAKELRGTTDDLMVLAKNIFDYTYAIPWTFSHSPSSFDAVYTLKWGNSCTGHAHAGAALFRANGIPARSLMNTPAWGSSFDMHWIMDYFIPDYGWMTIETSIGKYPAMNEDEIITLACNPEDEFPLFISCGIEGYWHTSDPALSNPGWGGGHWADKIVDLSASTDKIQQAHSLTDSVFYYYSHYQGIDLNNDQQTTFQTAFNYQETALAKFKASDLDGYISNMEQALANYRNVNPRTIETVFFDDFESGVGGWTHGGNKDEWELGTPTYSLGPREAHSGVNCWGTDLDNTYENSANYWLKTPPIDLTDYNCCAYLSCWIWNWVEDAYGWTPMDPLSMDITTDGGTTYSPLCSNMGGVNDDPEIPDVGGWSYLVLDLHKHLGKTVQIRFKFRSNSSNVQPGSYIDDVHVYGRKGAPSGIEVADVEGLIKDFSLSNYPNPFNPTTTIMYDIPEPTMVNISMYNSLGQDVMRLAKGWHQAGNYQLNVNASHLTSGIYFCRMTTQKCTITRKLLLLK